MRKSIVAAIACFIFLLPVTSAFAILVTLDDHEKSEAQKKGAELKAGVLQYVKKYYGFGGREAFEEGGIIRTRWSKLLVLAGLMADRGGKPTEHDLADILNNTDLQIDVHVYGNRMDFANSYRVHLIQDGKRIDALKVSADDVAYLPRGKNIPSGFPHYYATIRSYFSHGSIHPRGVTRIVLVKGAKEVVFEVNFADYK